MKGKTLIPFSNDIHFINFIKEQSYCFAVRQKTILFVEPYGSAIALLKHGAEKGFNLIILSANEDFRIPSATILELATVAIQINTANESDLMSLIKLLSHIIPIDAIIPGFEYFVPIAAKMSHFLKLPCIHPHQVLNLRRKDLMRDILKNSGIRTPHFYLVRSKEDLKTAMRLIGFPAVCKPIDAAGSVHVRKVTSESEAFAAALRILEAKDILWGYQLSPVLLYEEYIGGKEYSVEGVVQQDRVIYFSLTEKLVSDQVEFIEIGHLVNAFVPVEIKQSIENYVEKILKLFGANYCPFHAEIRMQAGQPLLMEVAARLAGDKIGDLINLTRKENYYDYVYAAYLGEKHTLVSPSHSNAAIRFFYRPTIDRYRTVVGVEQAKTFPLEEIKFYYKPDEIIPAFPKPLRRLGHVIANSQDREGMVSLLDQVDRCIQFLP